MVVTPHFGTLLSSLTIIMCTVPESKTSTPRHHSADNATISNNILKIEVESNKELVQHWNKQVVKADLILCNCNSATLNKECGTRNVRTRNVGTRNVGTVTTHLTTMF